MTAHLKTCTRCGEVKELSAFGKATGAKDGLKTWCRACNNAYVSAWQKTNRAAINAREYGTPEATERRRQQKRDYQRRHRDAMTPKQLEDERAHRRDLEAKRRDRG